MEGISHEACSLAGTLELGKLIAFWDDNGISIDGKVEGWFRDDTPKRFEAYGWHVIEVDGHNPDEIKIAIEAARAIYRQTVIDLLQNHHRFRLTQQGRQSLQSWRATRRRRGRAGTNRVELGAGSLSKYPKRFTRAGIISKLASYRKMPGSRKFAAYQEAHPELAAEFERRMHGDLPADWGDGIAGIYRRDRCGRAEKATRRASLATLEAIRRCCRSCLAVRPTSVVPTVPNGRASSRCVPKCHDANYINYGVREFGMSAMLNGIVLHGGFIPFGATFLVFSEYARNALRMAALDENPVVSSSIPMIRSGSAKMARPIRRLSRSRRCG